MSFPSEISSSTSANNDGQTFRSSIKKFLELTKEDFVIGVVASSESARSTFLEAIDRSTSSADVVDENPSKTTVADEIGIKIICIQRSSAAVDSRIILAISPEFTQNIKTDKGKIENLRKWIMASLGKDHTRSYAHFDALLYLHSADQLSVKRGFSLASYRDNFLQLLSGKEEYKDMVNSKGSCSHNFRRLRLVLLTDSPASAATAAESDLLLENYKDFWSLFSVDGSSHYILPEDASAFLATIADDEQEREIRNAERAFQKADKTVPVRLREPWDAVKPLLKRLTSSGNPRNLRDSIQEMFRKMGRLADEESWSVGKVVVAFFTREARRLLGAVMRRGLVVYRKAIISAASRGLVSMDKTKFYEDKAGKENDPEASNGNGSEASDQEVVSHN
ncbi:hypothetical protein D9756_008617 [Leucocoprinus leucothites]|uniref:Uncharacterized protein n=1 Tax=Leucocoprinus leucothites TaxID=201217 RepID=A0A8H5D1I3_9AGAR|nr:hypothetical protein D9756_008617 [Leucoagaricus leucothites]